MTITCTTTTEATDLIGLHPTGTYYTQTGPKDAKWMSTEPAALAAHLVGPTPPDFRTIHAVTQQGDEGKKAEWRHMGPLGFDLDGKEGDLDWIISQFHEFLDKLETDFDLDLAQVRIFLTGGRGMHIEIPPECFLANVPEEGIEGYPYMLGEIMWGCYVDGVDTRIYSGGKGRQWRVPNVKRSNGLYKVQVTLGEACALTRATYAELCAAPRPLFAPKPASLNPKLAYAFLAARDKITGAIKKRKSRPVADFTRMGGEVPESILNVMNGSCPFKAETGWNQIAVQLALLALGFGWSEDRLVEASKGLIESHCGDSNRYGTPGKRERELRNQYRYLDGNPAYEPSIRGLIALLDKHAPDLSAADDMLRLPGLDDFDVIEPEQPAANEDGELPAPPLAPFPGVMAEAVEAVLKASHKPQPEMAILGVLIGLAAAIPGNYSFRAARCNLYGFGLAPSGAGKDAPRRAAEDLAFRADVPAIGKPGSGQGLEDAVAEQGHLMMTVDEVGHLFAAINANRAQSHDIETAANMLKLFSASGGRYTTRALAGKKARVLENPMLSILGFSTPDVLGRALSSANIADGLMGRFLMVQGRPDAPPKWLNEGLKTPASVTDTARRIKAAGVQPLEIEASGTAETMLKNLQQVLHQKSVTAPDPVAKLLHIRSFEKLLRVAMVLAVWEAPEFPCITEQHVAWASQLVDSSDTALIEFARQHIHDGVVQGHAAMILRTVERLLARKGANLGKQDARFAERRGVSWSSALKGTKLAAREFQTAVEHLEATGDVHIAVDQVAGAKGRSSTAKGILLAS